MAFVKVKKPVTVICGRDGVPWIVNAEPRSPSEVAGRFKRPPKFRV